MSEEPKLAADSIQAMVFDLGGVLTTGLSEALLAVLADHGVDDPQSREEALACWRPLYIRASLGRMHPDELWRELRGVADLGTLLPGQEDEQLLSHIHLPEASIPHTLARLRERRPLGLLSNHVAPWARALLERFALTPLFEAVVISSEIGLRKPAAATYERVCAMLGVAPQHSVYIADEEEDLVGCQAVGMCPFFVAGQDAESRVGWEIKQLGDLLKLL